MVRMLLSIRASIDLGSLRTYTDVYGLLRMYKNHYGSRGATEGIMCLRDSISREDVDHLVHCSYLVSPAAQP